MRILILGGAGTMAEIIERDLLESDSGIQLVLADRDRRQLRQRAALLHRGNYHAKIHLAVMDIKSPRFSQQLRKTKAAILINATGYMLNTIVMDAAIRAKMHYIDLGGLYWKTREQLKRHSKAKAAGVTCILGMGETPGTMNILARQGGMSLDRVTRVDMRCGAVVVDKQKEKQQRASWSPPYAIQTLIDEVTGSPAIFRDGKMRFPPPLDKRIKFEMPAPIGKTEGYHTLHSELATLPSYFRKKGLKTMDFAYAYDQESLDVIMSLHKVQMTSKTMIKVDGASISPYQFLGLVDKQLIPRQDRDLRDAEAIRVDLYGTKDGKKANVTIDMIAGYHQHWKKSAGSVGTGVPASIIAQYLAKGWIDRPGVWAPEDVVEPIPFFKELSKQGRGMSVYVRINNGARRRLN